MSRPQNFDTLTVLQNATLVFWAQGYEATTLEDLLKATKLSKSSLYATFGGKRELFLAAFAEYRQERLRHMRRILGEEANGRDAITSFFRQVIERSMAGEVAGCMAANEAVELGPRDEDVRLAIAEDNDQVAALFEQAIRRGQIDGSIALTLDVGGLARALLVYLQGIQVMARAKTDVTAMKTAADLFLQVLG